MFGSMLQAFFGFLGGLINTTVNSKAQQNANDLNEQLVRETNLSNQAIQESVNLTNMSIQDSINQVNFAMNRETNFSNQLIARETNALQIAESEKAYQRSTASNQIAELVKAGYSYQQAKQIVAGSGSAAAYPPASLTAPTMVAPQAQAAQMQAAMMQAPQVDPVKYGDFGVSALGALGNIGDDFLRLDGGAFGMLGAQKNIDVVFDHMNDIDEDALTSPRAFQDWYRNPEVQKQNSWLDKDQVESFDRMFKHANQSRAFMQQTRELTMHFSDSHRFKGVKIENEQKNIQLAIDRLRETLTQSQVDLAAMDLELKSYQVQLAPANYNLVAQQLANEFETAKMQGDVLHKPEFRKAFMDEILHNQQYRDAFAYANLLHEKIKGMSGEAAQQYMSTHSVMFGIYDLFASYGMTSSDVGQIVALLQANGLDVSKLVNKILGKINDFVDTKVVTSRPSNQFGTNALIIHYQGQGAAAHGASW